MLKKDRRSRNRVKNERDLFVSTIGCEFDPNERRDVQNLNMSLFSQFLYFDFFKTPL